MSNDSTATAAAPVDGPKKAPKKSLKQKYATSPKHERDGVWYIPFKMLGETPEENKGAPQVLIARFGKNNPRFLAFWERLTRQERKQLDSGEMSQAKSRQLVTDAFFGTCVLGWRNWPDADEPIPFSEEAAREYLDAPEMNDLFNELFEAAKDGGTFAAEGLEAAIKNS